jgi:CheY-like chemotaxis protein
MTPKPPTVMVIDDDPEILETTSEYLRRRGLEVVSTRTALGTSALIKEHHPKVIVLDVEMPAMMGGSLAQLIRQQEHSKDIPLIFYSAIDESRLVRLSQSHHRAMCVPKGRPLDMLYKMIMSCLEPASASGPG